MDEINDNMKNEDGRNSLDSIWVNNFTSRIPLIAQAFLEVQIMHVPFYRLRLRLTFECELNLK